MCRRLLNIEAVEEALRPFGFEGLDPGLLSFDEQVKAFSEAEIVVGVMGAGMANTLFCPDGVKLLYLTTEEFGDPFFWDLAAILGHDYRCLYGVRQASDLPIHFSDFRVDSSTVLEHVQQLLTQRGHRA
jgi:capsular polysaccharide biosynthesis protein